MESNKISQLLGSFVIVPILTLSIPVSNPAISWTEANSPKARLLEKANIVVSGILAFNQDEDTVAKQEDAIKNKRAEAIDAYFANYDMPLSGYGMKMVEEAEKNDLDWRLLPAISVVETTGGRFLCKKLPSDKKWNPFGWGSCKIGFDSFNSAIETVAKNLGGNNPKTSHHYEGKTNKEILEKYNPPSIVPDYVTRVMKIMDKIGPANLGESVDNPKT